MRGGQEMLTDPKEAATRAAYHDIAASKISKLNTYQLRFIISLINNLFLQEEHNAED